MVSEKWLGAGIHAHPPTDRVCFDDTGDDEPDPEKLWQNWSMKEVGTFSKTTTAFSGVVLCPSNNTTSPVEGLSNAPGTTIHGRSLR
jgi:hypothetical protein